MPTAKMIMSIFSFWVLLLPRESTQFIFAVADLAAHIEYHQDELHTNAITTILEHLKLAVTHHNSDEHEDLACNHQHGVELAPSVSLPGKSIGLPPTYVSIEPVSKKLNSFTVFFSDVFVHSIWQPPKSVC